MQTTEKKRRRGDQIQVSTERARRETQLDIVPREQRKKIITSKEIKTSHSVVFVSHQDISDPKDGVFESIFNHRRFFSFEKALSLSLERECVPFAGARDIKDTKNLGNAPSHPTLFSARARTYSRRCRRRRCSRPPSLCTRSHFLRSSSTRTTRFEIQFFPGKNSSSSSPSLSSPRSNEQQQRKKKNKNRKRTRAKTKTFCSSSSFSRERAREEVMKKEEERPVPRAEETLLSFFYLRGGKN